MKTLTEQEFELKKIALMRQKIAKMQLGDYMEFTQEEYELTANALEEYYNRRANDYADDLILLNPVATDFEKQKLEKLNAHVNAMVNTVRGAV